jgi:hypothetical protein
MKNHRLLYISFGWLALLGVVHILAGFFYFYWTLWWFDNAMHFLGGLSMAFFTLWIVHALGFFKGVPRTSRVLFTVLASVVLIGIGWEVFEYVFGIANPSIGQTYASDTSFDLFFDLLGALVAGLFAKKPKFYLPQRNG